MVGVFAALTILAITVDGRIVAWSRNLAQSVADASALAGASSLQELLRAPEFACGQTSDSLIVDQIQLYADLNQPLDTTRGMSVQAYYLGRDDSGALSDLINPETGSRWKAGATGSVPCGPVYGLHVEVYYPQETLMTRLFGIDYATIRVEATATWEETGWCNNYAVYGLDASTATAPVTITGSGLAISGGGIHSSGGLALHGDRETPIRLDPDFPVTIGKGAEAGLAWEGVTPEQGIMPVRAGSTLPPGFFYDLADFQPGGFLWRAADSRGQAHSLSGGFDGSVIALSGDGLYVTDGPVRLDTLPPRSDGSPWQVTIVTEDRITVAPSLAADLAPYAAGVLFYSGSADAEGAIAIVEDTNRLAGLILAPGGTIALDIAGDAVLEGMLLGNRITVHSAGGVIRHQRAYCPPAPGSVALIGAPAGTTQVAQGSAGENR